MFKETEYCKTISITIINDNQYEADVDFYMLLKNPSSEAGLGDPSVTRITIIDDDGMLLPLMFKLLNITQEPFFIKSSGLHVHVCPSVKKGPPTSC